MRGNHFLCCRFCFFCKSHGTCCSVSAVSEQPDLNFSLDQKEEDPPHIKVEEEDPWSDQQTSEPNSFVCPSNSADTSQQEDDDASSVPDASGLDVMELDAPGCASASETYSNPNGDDVAAVNGQLSGGAAASSYVCTACGQVFPQRAQWARHVQTHRKVETKGDRSYTCDICGKRLTRFDGYQKHLRVHTGEKPYCCDLCGRRFSDNSNYKRHFRTHAAQKSKQSWDTATDEPRSSAKGTDLVPRTLRLSLFLNTKVVFCCFYLQEHI